MLGAKGILPPTDVTDCYIAMQLPQSYGLNAYGKFKLFANQTLLLGQDVVE